MELVDDDELDVVDLELVGVVECVQSLVVECDGVDIIG